MASYQGWVKTRYGNSQSRYVMSIERYVKNVIEKLPNIEKDEIYEPIRVSVILGRDPTQCVPLHVDYADKWYEKLQNAVKEMTKLPVSSQIELVDISGKGIKDLDAKSLACVGKVKARNNNKPIALVLNKLPEPPKDMRTDKLLQLKNWHESSGLKENTINLIAETLKEKKSKHEIKSALCVGSDLEKQLKNIVNSSTPSKNMEKFLNIYGCNEKARTGTPSSDVLSKITQNILKCTIVGLNAAENRIDRHLAQSAVANITSGNIGELFASSSASDGKPVENSLEMYKSIVRKQLNKPSNVLELIQNVYRATPINCCSKTDDDDENEKYYSDYFYGEQEIYNKYQILSDAAVYMEYNSNSKNLNSDLNSDLNLDLNEEIDSDSLNLNHLDEERKQGKLRTARLRKKLYQQQQASKIEASLGPKIVPVVVETQKKMPGLIKVSELVKTNQIKSELTNTTKSPHQMPGLIKANLQTETTKSSQMPGLIKVDRKMLDVRKNEKGIGKFVPFKTAPSNDTDRINDGFPDINDYKPKKRF
jgi:hypothetical protein